MRVLITVLLFISGDLLASSISSDPLTVIYDSGNTLPIDPYVKMRRESRTQPLLPKNNRFPTMRYPVTTPGMSPGAIAPQAMPIPHFQIPLFIIGNDTFSKNWLEANIDKLRQLNAVGLLVEADNHEEADQIRTLAAGLRIEVVSGEEIAKQLDVKHYPILISNQGIEQ